MHILVTGGAGFIGSNFLNRFVPNNSDHYFTNIDCLTYAANLMNLFHINCYQNYYFEKANITDSQVMDALFAKYNPDAVINFAAESHVDRSIEGPADFIQTNIIGTFNLLECCRKHWSNYEGKRFLHISTDEVFGSLGPEGFFTETTAYDPSSPYSASKASSDHLVRAYHRTYGLPAIITNCSNNYGPYQFPEKLIPLMICNALEGKPLPIYGKGENVRDWLYVEDHVRAIWAVLEHGIIGETYNIGGGNEMRNIDLVNMLCEIIAEVTGQNSGSLKALITFVKDRPGHDQRYAIDSTKIQAEIGWKPQESIYSGLRKTVKWYTDNREWVTLVKSGEYQKWIELNYHQRKK